MTETVDKLIFELGADASPLDKAYAEAEAKSQKAGKAIQANLSKGFEGTAANAQKAGAEIGKTMDGTAAAAAKATASIDALRMKYDTAFAATKKLAQTQTELNQLVAAGVLTTSAAAKVMKELADTTTHGHGATSTATREFRALFDELSSGRTRQTPGTLAIIATRVFGISGATLAWGAALAGIPAALAVAGFQAESTMSRIDDALRRTGYQAGVTRDQILAMAHAGIPGMSETGAIESLSAMASRGNIAPGLLRSAAASVPGYARATGQDEDKARQDLEKLFSDPSKGAAQLNEEFKLLDSTTTRQIEHLQASGREEEAQAILIAKSAERFQTLNESSFSLAAAFSGLGKKLSDFWFKTGEQVTGKAPTKAEEIATLKAANEGTLKTLADRGMADPHAFLAAHPNAGVNVGGGITPLRNIMAEFDANAKKISDLQKATAAEIALVNAQWAQSQADKNVNNGRNIAEQYDEQAKTAKKLNEQYDALNVAVAAATGKNAQYREELIRQRDAVDLARKNQKTPAEIAAGDAADQRRIAAAPESQRNTLRAQLAAQRERERNLANPSTAPYAESIYQSQMGVASLNNKDINSAASERKRQDDYLAKAKAEGEAQLNLAAAYDKGANAVAAMRAAQQAKVAVAAGEIRASQESALASAIQTAAYGKATAAVAERIAQEHEANEGLRKVAAAGGDPVSVAKARIEAEAMAATYEERANARTKEEIDLANKKLGLLRAELTAREDLNRAAQTDAEIKSKGRELGNVRGQIGALGAGANSDDMRHLEIQQRTIEELIQRGYDPLKDEFKTQLGILLPLNEALSDANDHLDKMRTYAKDLASGITGPLKGLTHGANPMDVLAEMGQNTLDTLVQHELLDPLQKSLEGMFGGMLGIGETGDSPLNPMWVRSADGILGGAGGGGGLLDAFGLGAGQDGGMLGRLFTSFFGLFDDGGVIPPGGWGIKSGMPEIIQGGTNGVSVMPLNAPVVRASVAAMGRGDLVNSNPGGPGNGTVYGRSVNHFWNITTPSVADFIRSKSQIESRFTMAAARGQRNV